MLTTKLLFENPHSSDMGRIIQLLLEVFAKYFVEGYEMKSWRNIRQLIMKENLVGMAKRFVCKRGDCENSHEVFHFHWKCHHFVICQHPTFLSWHSILLSSLVRHFIPSFIGESVKHLVALEIVHRHRLGSLKMCGDTWLSCGYDTDFIRSWNARREIFRFDQAVEVSEPFRNI